jgi:hypothetical protein
LPVGRARPRFRRGFDNVHPLIDEPRDFDDFNDEEIGTLQEFISTTESCQTLVTDTLQQLMTPDESSSKSHEKWNEEDESRPSFPLNPNHPLRAAISSFNLEERVNERVSHSRNAGSLTNFNRPRHSVNKFHPTTFVFNLDESSFQDWAERPESTVVVPSGYRDDDIMMPVERAANRNSLLICIAADGTDLKPVFIPPRKTIDEELAKQGIINVICKVLRCQERDFVIPGPAQVPLIDNLLMRLDMISDTRI